MRTRWKVNCHQLKPVASGFNDSLETSTPRTLGAHKIKRKYPPKGEGFLPTLEWDNNIMRRICTLLAD